MKKCLAALIIVLSMLFSTVFAHAAADPAVVLVNPAANSTVYSTNLLISIKVTQPKTIKVKVFEEKQMVNGTLSAININSLSVANGTLSNASFTPVLKLAAVTYTCSNNLSFFTKQVNDVSPGLYRIQIETVDENGKVLYTNNSYVAVKEKTEGADAKIFETPQSGTMQFLQNLLKSIFGN
ncbi:hypothetical protein [Sinanaerobacter chloroacetimidivorans]|jgi:hypothetical protein|uniref:Uncharacterized protein n=1 Tax=Sinanaerobacter chloroacetimidivorans TaxID=2818044 RepID=A0A8J8B2X5_9FIRM|nr:hypothetical protein [Sinanaerobacter chloroacetimidivorans]MBR0597700.1 hypothetical protein [Sinanaerobacter chloroacetimidivorans]